jgi:hypothetical protein
MVEISELTAELQRLIRLPIGGLSQVERQRHELYLRTFGAIIHQMMAAGIETLPGPPEPPAQGGTSP